MRIEGAIYGHNNAAITANVTILDSAGNVLSTLQIDAGSKYAAEYDENTLRSLQFVFTSQGYRSQTATGAELIDSGSNIHLEKANTLFLLAIAVGLFYVLSNKKKKVGALTKNEILPFVLIAGAVIGFTVIEKLLQKLGIWKSGDTKSLDTASTNPNSFWNPEYWKSLPAGSQYTRPITLSTAKQYAGEIYSSFGPFNDCEECVKGVFKRLPSQAAASYVSYAFNSTYGADLLDFLRGGIWPQDRLSDSDVSEINLFVNSLPKY